MTFKMSKQRLCYSKNKLVKPEKSRRGRDFVAGLGLAWFGRETEDGMFWVTPSVRGHKRTAFCFIFY
jgi:hypothetical protein